MLLGNHENQMKQENAEKISNKWKIPKTWKITPFARTLMKHMCFHGLSLQTISQHELIGYRLEIVPTHFEPWTKNPAKDEKFAESKGGESYMSKIAQSFTKQ